MRNKTCSGVISFVLMVMLCLSLSITVHAENSTTIRSIYDSTVTELNSTKISKDVRSAYDDYNVSRETFLSEVNEYESYSFISNNAKVTVVELTENFVQSKAMLDELELTLRRKVKEEAPITTIIGLEAEYTILKQEVDTYAFNIDYELAKYSAAELAQLNRELPDNQRVIDQYDLLMELKADYDIVIEMEDFGDITQVEIPTSLGVYVINSPYGTRTNFGPFSGGNGSHFHDGLDIKAPFGTEIQALFSGVVVVSSTSSSYGNYVIIDHGDGIRTMYAHATENYASVGDRVSQYQPIQSAGSTGWSTGPHLHLIITIDGEYVDPQILFDRSSAYV